MHKRKRSLRLDPILDEELRWDQPERYEMNMRRIRAWEQVREMSRMRHYADRRTLENMTREKVEKALSDAVRDMNNWLFKGEFGDHPNNVFVNFLKKSLAKESGG